MILYIDKYILISLFCLYEHATAFVVTSVLGKYWKVLGNNRKRCKPEIIYLICVYIGFGDHSINKI